MKYLKDTIVDYIKKECTRDRSKVTFVMPSYSSVILLEVGQELDEYFGLIPDRKVKFEYGIAYKLGQVWKNGSAADRANFEQISRLGWYNEDDNLTQLRNKQKDHNIDNLVVIMAGYEHINDRESLRDFFHLDQEAVWNICLNKSFKSWLEKCLGNYINLKDSKKDINRIEEALKTLYFNGLADLIRISSYLEKQDFSVVMDGTDAYNLVLANLSSYKLPSLIGLRSRYTKKKSFADYVDSALNFFSYSMFLDTKEREKSIQKINQFKEELNEGNVELPDQELLGSFGNVNELIEALNRYIEQRTDEDKQKLYSVDFVYILEEIIGFKKKSDSTTRTPKPKKLKGLPLEVILRGVWLTLADYKNDLKSQTMFIGEDLKAIRVRTIAFRHDFDSGEDGDNLSDKERAELFLTKIIGGIDRFLENMDVELDVDGRKVKIDFLSSLSPECNDELSYQKSFTAEPWLKFEVLLQTEQKKLIKREFRWALPQNHQCRTMVSLFGWVVENYQGKALPAFGLPYIAELFSASEEEGASRILNTALQSRCEFIDLLKVPGIDEKDPVKKDLLDLSYTYQEFLLSATTAGFFTALESAYESLRKSYTKAYETFLDNRSNSELAPILYKAFLIVSEEEAHQSDWGWRDNLLCAVVTPLHPALLEMIVHQHGFLRESFCTYVAEALSQPKIKMLTEKNWSQLVDLATLNRPIYGVLEKNQILNTNSKGYDYIHLIGEFKGDSSFIDSRLLLEYEVDDDEDITDAELFEESRTSRLIEQTIKQYVQLYPFAEDGISIGAFCGKDIQVLIAGIDSFLKEVINNPNKDGEIEANKDYALSFTIFSDSRDDSSMMKWINAWKDRWQAAELSGQNKFYSNCKISINYRVVASAEDYSHFKSLLQGLDLDIMIFADFVKSDESRFEPLDEDLDVTDDYRKFPILEKTCCRTIGGGKDLQRERVLSNQRFRLGRLHAEIMAYLRNKLTKRNAVICRSNFQPWKQLIDTAHEQCTWVVCIDPSIDEHLLCKDVDKREIIGLGTGVGPHGENNYTVSTEKFALIDIKQKIGGLIGSLIENLSKTENDLITGNLIEQAVQIAGLSIVKATGPLRFVRELIANSLVRKLTRADENVFCDELISLDAFSHWFHDTDKRPDLLRVKATIVNGYFDIEAQIIECKLAMYGGGYLEKAREQLESGIRRLAGNFRPRGETPVGIKDKPDQRYWWMQLHRLIANKGETDTSSYRKAILALERLSEGYFNIKWQAAAVAIWTDIDSYNLDPEQEWQFNYDRQELRISVLSVGKDFIKAVCLDDKKVDIFSNSVLHYECPKLAMISNLEEDSALDESRGVGVEEVEEPLVVTAQDEDKDDNEIVKDKKQLPQRILLGSYTPERNIYWEFGHPDLPNRHILVFGASGTGKTYTIQALLCELGKLDQNSLIVDYTNGFTNKQLEPVVVDQLKPRQHIIRNEPLGVNPFRQQADMIDDMELLENPTNIAQRVAGVFQEVYQLGDQQKSALYNAIRSGIMKDGNGFNLSKLIRELEVIQEAGGPTANSAASVISKIQPFIDMHPFGQEDVESWEKLYNDETSKCHVIQLAGFAKDTARLITEFSLIDLYWYYRSKGSKDNPKIVVLDEIQNLDHRLESPIGQFLTEGRKFGIALILATQTLSNLGKDERDRLFQASHKLFFKPADTEVRSFAQILADATGLKSDEWVERLSSLKRGECYSLGYTYNEQTDKLEVGKSFKIKIKALEERF